MKLPDAVFTEIIADYIMASQTVFESLKKDIKKEAVYNQKHLTKNRFLCYQKSSQYCILAGVARQGSRQ